FDRGGGVLAAAAAHFAPYRCIVARLRNRALLLRLDAILFLRHLLALRLRERRTGDGERQQQEQQLHQLLSLEHALPVNALILVLGELALLERFFPARAIAFGPLAAAQLRYRGVVLPGAVVRLALVLALLVDHDL